MGDEQALLALAEAEMRRVFGYSSFRPGQRQVIGTVLEKKSVLVIRPTEGGKSLCFQIPALLLPGITLVVSPLISSMKDQVDDRTLSGYSATFINSLLEQNLVRERLNGLYRGQDKLFFVAPKRFANPKVLDLIRQLEISLLTIDEAHCTSRWGHDFRPSCTRLGRVREHLGNVQTIATTATTTRRVQKDILAQFRLRDCQVFATGFDRPLNAGYLEESGERYPVMKVTPEGWCMLRSEILTGLSVAQRVRELEAGRFDIELFEKQWRLRSFLAKKYDVALLYHFPGQYAAQDGCHAIP